MVLPISYSPRNGQHHYNLRTYKGSAPSEQAGWNLLAVLLLFLREHLKCVESRMGAAPTHVAVVPSTRGRPGPHPLAALIMPRIDLPLITSSVRTQHGPDDRDFHSDWFAVTVPPHSSPVHALILDDTWTTGARAQSLAYALKSAGSTTVTTVVLGRHVDPDYQPSKRLLKNIADPLFDTTRCAAEDAPT